MAVALAGVLLAAWSIGWDVQLGGRSTSSARTEGERSPLSVRLDLDRRIERVRTAVAAALAQVSNPRVRQASDYYSHALDTAQDVASALRQDRPFAETQVWAQFMIAIAESDWRIADGLMDGR